jgi:gamma-glutamyltranspeptidase
VRQPDRGRREGSRPWHACTLTARLRTRTAPLVLMTDSGPSRATGGKHVRGYCVANLLDIYQNHSFELQMELAGMLDLEPLVTATYKLEGDRLEVRLAYDMVEELRTFGGSLDESETTGLVNSAAVARNNHTIAVGSDVREYGVFWRSVQ